MFACCRKVNESPARVEKPVKVDEVHTAAPPVAVSPTHQVVVSTPKASQNSAAPVVEDVSFETCVKNRTPDARMENASFEPRLSNAFAKTSDQDTPFKMSVSIFNVESKEEIANRRTTDVEVVPVNDKVPLNVSASTTDNNNDHHDKDASADVDEVSSEVCDNEGATREVRVEETAILAAATTAFDSSLDNFGSFVPQSTNGKVSSDNVERDSFALIVDSPAADFEQTVGEVVEKNDNDVEEVTSMVGEEEPVVQENKFADEEIVEEVAPVVEETFAVEVATAVEEITVEEVVPVVEEIVVEEIAPVVEEIIVEEVAPIVEETVVEEIAPVVEDSKPVFEEPVSAIIAPVEGLVIAQVPEIEIDLEESAPVPAPVVSCLAMNPSMKESDMIIRSNSQAAMDCTAPRSSISRMNRDRTPLTLGELSSVPSSNIYGTNAKTSLRGNRSQVRLPGIGLNASYSTASLRGTAPTPLAGAALPQPAMPVPNSPARAKVASGPRITKEHMPPCPPALAFPEMNNTNNFALPPQPPRVGGRAVPLGSSASSAALPMNFSLQDSHGSISSPPRRMNQTMVDAIQPASF